MKSHQDSSTHMCPNPPVRDHTLGKAGITEVPGLLSAFSAVLGRDEMPPLLSFLEWCFLLYLLLFKVWIWSVPHKHFCFGSEGAAASRCLQNPQQILNSKASIIYIYM